MGSFVYNFHVKCNDAGRVAGAVTGELLAEGNECADEMPVELEASDGDAKIRGLHISDALGGWVSVLDSNPSRMADLAKAVSKRLETYVIVFVVSDSDSWGYELHYLGVKLDEFNSQSNGGAGLFEAEGVDLGRLSASDFPDLQQYQSEIRKRIEYLWENEAPPEVKMVQSKMFQGDVTKGELDVYVKWMESLAQRVADYIKSILPDETLERVAEDVKKRSMQIDRAGNYRCNLSKIRPVILPGIGDERILEVLRSDAVFAEGALSEFMELLGIHPVLANLSYWYLEEFSQTELDEIGVRFARHVRFRRKGKND